jgi:hypothetical protein
VNLLQAWLIVGIPTMGLALGLFAGRAKHRAWFGYGVLAALVLFLVLVPGDVISAALVGLVAVGFLAVGRGTGKDDEYQEHHQGRRAYTTRDAEA